MACKAMRVEAKKYDEERDETVVLASSIEAEGVTVAPGGAFLSVKWSRTDTCPDRPIMGEALSEIVINYERVAEGWAYSSAMITMGAPSIPREVLVESDWYVIDLTQNLARPAARCS